MSYSYFQIILTAAIPAAVLRSTAHCHLRLVFRGLLVNRGPETMCPGPALYLLAPLTRALPAPAPSPPAKDSLADPKVLLLC